jgi:uncharacterized membrane protein (DUF2068 family)
METTRWTNPSQPQTLQSAVILLYVSAALGLIFALNGFSLAIGAAQVAAGWGCANEKRWAYWLGVVVAALPIAVLLRDPSDVLALAFDILLLVLLLHTQTRAYQRIWFR